jgi:heme-degrading monooxygenase HmoA
VIFTARRTDIDEAGYEAMAESMITLAAQQPGHLGVESVRDAETSLGITVSYWADEASAVAWKQHPEHLIAQAEGRDRWYSHYETRVATVTRAYGRG